MPTTPCNRPASPLPSVLPRKQQRSSPPSTESLTMPTNPSIRPSSPLSSTPPPKRQRPNPAPSLLSPLQSLLHFWLSPCNLSKDQFLTSAMLRNDGWIPVSLFTTFNKAIALNATSSDILAALRSLPSPSLEYRDISSQPKVRLQGGATKLQQIVNQARKDEDGRTIYLEPLAPSATREQVEALFSRFGNVTYVSIPRFPNGRCKGFCFLEFSEIEAARCALKNVNEGKVAIGGEGETRGLWRVDWRNRKEMFKEEVRKKKLEEARRRHGFQVRGDKGVAEEEGDRRRKGKGGRQRRMKKKGAKDGGKGWVEGTEMADADMDRRLRDGDVSEEAKKCTAGEAKRKPKLSTIAEAEDDHGGRAEAKRSIEDSVIEQGEDGDCGKMVTRSELPVDRGHDKVLEGCGNHDVQSERGKTSAGEEQEDGNREVADSTEWAGVAEERRVEREEYEVGLILEVDGVGKGMSRKDIYLWMKQFGKVAFVDVAWFKTDKCRVRFSDVEGVSNALKGIVEMSEGMTTPSIEGKMVGRVLTGKEEEEYWKHVRERQGRRKERGERKKGDMRGKR